MIQDWEQLDNTVDLSLLLNNLLQEYYNKTRDVNVLLEQDSEESLKKIDQILQERETIIKQYNIIKEKSEALRAEASINNLDQLEEKRREILGLIRAIELSNLNKSKQLFDNYKDKIRDLNTGKKAIQAYNAKGPLSDGFFVDKRK